MAKTKPLFHNSEDDANVLKVKLKTLNNNKTIYPDLFYNNS